MVESTWVVTPVHGRHEHLREQRRVLASVAPGVGHVVVAMDDRQVDDVLAECGGGAGAEVMVRHVGRHPLGLPLAHARNLGVEAAIAAGATLVVLLDVDCVPGADLVSAYEQAAAWAPGALLAGPVTYLEERNAVPRHPQDLSTLRSPHPARPDPPPGEIERGADPDLFWSLSCALTPTTWRAVGGFHEGYVGYGAEDTDFGRLARARGVDLVWVGGADAYHQFHPVSRPPTEHLGDIVRNATTFRERWGEWPMQGWLAEFARRGLVDWDGERLLLSGTRKFGEGSRG